VFSQYVETRYAARLLAAGTAGVGYLLKERVSDIAVLIDALQRVRDGEWVLEAAGHADGVRRRTVRPQRARIVGVPRSIEPTA